MAFDTGTVVIFFFLIFGCLEMTIVVIPAMISRSKVQRRYQPEYTIPTILSRPIPADDAVGVRSWYSQKNVTFRYINTITPDPVVTVTSGFPEGESPIFSGRHQRVQPAPETDWEARNKAYWAVQRANKAVMEANRAVIDAKTAIQQAGSEDLDWIDEIAEMEKLRLLREK
jgi:hypothetical protein